MKKIAILFFSMLMCISVSGCNNNKTGFMNEKDIKQLDSNPVGVITFSFIDQDQNLRTFPINFELYYDKAPITVTNFVKLVNDKFYDDTFNGNFGMTEGSEYINVDTYTFDEDDLETGYDESTYKIQKTIEYFIKGEFKNNGWDKNDLKHTFGTMSMIRSEGFDTAGSDFIICLDNDGFANRDDDYAVFGKLLNIDNSFFEGLKRLNGSFDSYEFKVVSITVNTNGVDLGVPLKINK